MTLLNMISKRTKMKKQVGIKDMNKAIPKGLYVHYKGKKYRVIGTARNSETLDEMVIYQAQYVSKEFGKNACWIRPKKMFEEKVKYKGKIVQRFKKV